MSQTQAEQNIVEQGISSFGQKILSGLASIGEVTIFIKESVVQVVRPPFRFRLVLQQMEFIGNQSLTIVLICGFFIGAAVSLQVGTIFVIFGAEGMLGAANGKALSRELSPLITGFLLAGRAGASMTAEIASMKVNEQIDAMESMAVDPINYLVAPRLIASVIMLPLLVSIFNLVGQMASVVIGIFVFNIDQGAFFEKMVNIVSPSDIWSGLQKAIIFGGIIALFACRFGLTAKGGAKGVGQATTNSVVTILLVLLLVDFITTYIQIVL
ncbi:MlaE family ABC transporter permease [Pseudobacteriovorax antillogorgiicola]|uniref:Phospholipid/cholesterol/gamma-HCH transport system permease protein n=1 Tax=Pseudobacteriovorax antillogorgiicola TaxID=1513793 RepID=A0A1Y6BU29_9BACT|nr:ABC transporter permease [Pseudobacteriovorax antillogorgiicola]TCS53870.1 phospholipid/cholesterol/gamma-HCH transport system permease protein [Pseudobacteriovorax antillogorgiicola]SMF21338.1 phospholipid/cholesterol/gamma-HCH transport system permease protein [Pseudobacteriovorax antillogorgiicola]